MYSNANKSAINKVCKALGFAGDTVSGMGFVYVHFGKDYIYVKGSIGVRATFEKLWCNAEARGFERVRNGKHPADTVYRIRRDAFYRLAA
jgi:hypothetical protein